MKRESNHSVKRVDLGAASLKTRGATGNMTDLVRYMEHWGIRND